MWDTAGQERYNTLTSAFFKGSDGILVVFSVCDRRSFENVNKWMSQIKNMAPENVTLLLVGNKVDLKQERVVSEMEGREMSERFKTKYFESSALTGENIK